MDKLLLLIHHPLDAMLLLIGGAITSIFGAAIKDGILKIASLFSQKYKKTRISNHKKLYQEARSLLLDTTYLTLYLFKAMRFTLIWIASMILCGITGVLVQAKLDVLFLRLRLGLEPPPLFDVRDPDAISFQIFMISMLLLGFVSVYTGTRSSKYLGIIYKAQAIRLRQIRLAKK